MISDWKTMKLGDLLYDMETFNPEAYPENIFDYVDVSSVDNKRFLISDSTKIYGKNAPSRARRLIKSGDVIFATVRPTLNRIAIVPEELDGQICSTGFFVLKPREIISNKLLFYYLQTRYFYNQMETLQNGASYPAVNDSQVRNQMISFPLSRQEQQRIIEILDQSFAAIDQAIANTEKNLKNAKDLFETKLNSFFNYSQNGWITKKIKDIGFTQTGTTPSTLEPDNYGNFIPFIKPADIDIGNHGKINYNNIKLSQKGLSGGRLISKNSVLMVCIGTLGKVGFTTEDISCNQQINTLTVFKEYSPKFFYYALRSNFFVDQVYKNSSQLTLPIINKSKWENLSVYFPPMLSEQTLIANQLDILSNEINKLELCFKIKLENLKTLKQSILQKAFNGELT